jgi:hypothetical protein
MQGFGILKLGESGFGWGGDSVDGNKETGKEVAAVNARNAFMVDISE